MTVLAAIVFAIGLTVMISGAVHLTKSAPGRALRRPAAILASGVAVMCTGSVLNMVGA
nr:hypothetical protein [Rhodococcus sp. 06-621-2]